MENEGILLHRRGYAIWITEESEYTKFLAGLTLSKITRKYNDTKERNVKRCIVYEQYAIIL